MKLPLRQADDDNASQSTMYRQFRNGRLVRIARGIYVPAGAEADWDQVEAVARQPRATICLSSALAHHDLTDEIPSRLDIAIPRSGRTPTGSPSIAWHSFDRDTFEIGRTLIRIDGTDLQIGLYSAERSIADAFRLRGSMGYEIGRDALQEWLRRGGKPSALLHVASQLPRTKGIILQALEYLA